MSMTMLRRFDDEYRIHPVWQERSDLFASQSDVRMALRRNQYANEAHIRRDISIGKIGEFVVFATFKRLGLLFVSTPSTEIYSIARRSHDADLYINDVGVSIKTCEVSQYGTSWVFQDTDIAYWDHAKKPVVVLTSLAGNFVGIHGIVSSRFAVENLEETRKQIANKKALYEKRIPLPWMESSASINDLCLSPEEGEMLYQTVLRWRERCDAYARQKQYGRI